MYYIRKIAKRSSLFKLQATEDIKNLDADFLKSEMGTNENTLSFWKCDDLEKINDTLKAILLSTSSIETTQFIIIDSTILKEYGLELQDNEGVTGYKGFSNLHTDICNLTYQKIGVLLNVYKITIEKDSNIPSFLKDKVKDLIISVIKDDLLDHSKINSQLLGSIEKLKL